MDGATSPGKRPREELDDHALASAILESTSQKTRPSKRPRVESRSSLFVRSLPPNATDESLAVFFSEHCPVKHATVVIDPKTKTSRGYGFVTLADPDDAAKAKESLDNTDWEGRRLRIELAEPRHRSKPGDIPGKASDINGKLEAEPSTVKKGTIVYEKTPKLIVRNLPWTIKESGQLSALFRGFGKIKYADLPQSKGKLSGFGFVTIRGKKNAHKAIDMMNGKVVDGRTLAVDWAVDKDVWEKHRLSDDKLGGDVAAPSQISSLPKAKAVAAAINQGQNSADADLQLFMENHMQHLEDEDDANDDEKSPEAENGTVRLGSERSWTDVSSGSPAPAAIPKKVHKTDSTKSTLFVRNLPFTVTDEQLGTFFSRFGRVRYARTVSDRQTGRPSGTGFVCFFNEAEARACIIGAPRIQAVSLAGKRSVLQDEAADPGGLYTLEARVLSVVQAVAKEEASKFSSDDKSGKVDDKRRLFLLSEGAVDTRSTLYASLAPSEIKMRENSIAQRRKLVQKNPNLCLSLTRLAVRHLPRNVNSKDLKELARKAVVNFASDVREGRRQPLSKEESRRDGAGGKEADRRRKAKRKGIVHQCKVVFETREGSKTSESTGGKSRGYGFIEYTTHRSALMGLRWLNGHQLVSDDGKKSRLVVEFAIENAQVIARRHASERKFERQVKAPDEMPTGQDSARQQRVAAETDVKPNVGAAGTDRLTATNTKVTNNKVKKQKRGSSSAKSPVVSHSSRGEGTDSKTSKCGGKKRDGEDVRRQLVVRQRLVRKKKMVSRGGGGA